MKLSTVLIIVVVCAWFGWCAHTSVECENRHCPYGQKSRLFIGEYSSACICEAAE